MTPDKDGGPERRAHLLNGQHLADVVLSADARLMRTYADHDAIGMTDAVNAVLAWALPQPVVLALDRHYRNVIAPRTASEQPLHVLPAAE